ncbi:MAG: hypothetical protein VCC99_06195 [Alphaproteobacteria bacterium]
MDDPYPDEPDTIDAWPLCPGCSERRHTMCRICCTAGTDFPPADHEVVEMVAVHGLDEGGAADSPEPIERVLRMLMCSTCDEPFEPSYARRCEWCGHDFGEGYEVVVRHTEPVAPRTIAVGVALVVAMLGLMVYFAVIVG